MALVVSDRIKETTTTTGTGTYTLAGAVTGFETFTANLSNGDTTYYACSDGTDFEVGLGTFTSSGTTLARTTILASSNSNNAVSWSSGTRTIFCTLPAAKAVFKDASDNINGTFVGNITGNVTGNTSGTAATVTGAAQTNITSLGTLTGLTIDGDATFTGTSGNIVFDKSDDALEFADEVKAKFGTGGDLEIFHSASGNVSVIRESGAGSLYIDSTNLYLRSSQSDGFEALASFIVNGAVELYHNNVKKFETSSTGATVTGELKTTTLEIGGTDVTSTAAELNILDGVTATTAELNIMDGVTSTTAELNILDGVTATATEINKLDGVTATTTEINYVDVTTLGTVEASKAVTADANGDVKFSDLDVLSFGTGADLKIFHNPNHSVIQEQGSGSLFIDASNLTLRNGAGAANYATFTDGGAAELNHNNVKKFETTSDGATVTGDLTLTSTDAGSQEDPSLILYRNSSSPADSDEIAEILFRGRNDNSQDVDYSKITGHAQDVSDGTEDAYMRFFTKVGGSDQQHIQLGFGTTDIFGRLRLNGNTLFSDPAIVFEGSTADDYETELKVVDPTADRTITFPDATGTVLTTGNSDTPTTTTSSSDADFVLVDDGGTMKKITPANLGITSGGASKGFAVAMAIAL